jgi:hypothetical protein
MSHRMACLKLLKHLTPHLTNVCRLTESSSSLTQGACVTHAAPKKVNVFVCYNPSEECPVFDTSSPTGRVLAYTSSPH